MDLIRYLMFVQHVGDGILELVFMAAWCIWYNRNVVRHRSTCQSAQMVVQKTRMLIDEFQVANHSCWYRILSTLDLCAGPWKTQKYHFLSIGPREHLEWRDTTHSNVGAPKVHFLAKMPLVNLELIEGQTRSKSTQNNNFHSFSSNPNFSKIFNYFDQVWLEVDFGWAQKP